MTAKAARTIWDMQIELDLNTTPGHVPQSSFIQCLSDVGCFKVLLTDSTTGNALFKPCVLINLQR